MLTFSGYGLLCLSDILTNLTVFPKYFENLFAFCFLKSNNNNNLKIFKEIKSNQQIQIITIH